MEVREYWRDRQRKARADAKKRGLCGQCMARKPKPGKVTCERCLKQRVKAGFQKRTTRR